MIALTGNTLGIDALFVLNSNEIIQSMSKEDYLIVLGNCGVTAAHTDFYENILLYRDLPCSVLYLDGGHDDYDLLSDHPLFPWNGGMIQNISRGITHLVRGQVFTLQGSRFFTMGGSTTPGRNDVGKYYDWWPEQDIFPTEMVEAERNLSDCNHCVDFILSCECPTSWHKMTGGVTTPCSEALDSFLGKVDYGHWYFSDYSTRDYPEVRASSISTDVVVLGQNSISS